MGGHADINDMRGARKLRGAEGLGRGTVVDFFKFTRLCRARMSHSDQVNQSVAWSHVLLPCSAIEGIPLQHRAPGGKPYLRSGSAGNHFHPVTALQQHRRQGAGPCIRCRR